MWSARRNWEAQNIDNSGKSMQLVDECERIFQSCKGEVELWVRINEVLNSIDRSEIGLFCEVCSEVANKIIQYQKELDTNQAMKFLSEISEAIIGLNSENLWRDSKLATDDEDQRLSLAIQCSSAKNTAQDSLIQALSALLKIKENNLKDLRYLRCQPRNLAFSNIKKLKKRLEKAKISHELYFNSSVEALGQTVTSLQDLYKSSESVYQSSNLLNENLQNFHEDSFKILETYLQRQSSIPKEFKSFLDSKRSTLLKRKQLLQEESEKYDEDLLSFTNLKKTQASVLLKSSFKSILPLFFLYFVFGITLGYLFFDIFLSFKPADSSLGYC